MLREQGDQREGDGQGQAREKQRDESQERAAQGDHEDQGAQGGDERLGALQVLRCRLLERRIEGCVARQVTGHLAACQRVVDLGLEGRRVLVGRILRLVDAHRDDDGAPVGGDGAGRGQRVGDLSRRRVHR